ncbi:MAG: hypothetical protein CME71_09360 [Halobacteriovorax sp.]|nr:hypothetical protein [Halobacteriovorax sp.]
MKFFSLLLLCLLEVAQAQTKVNLKQAFEAALKREPLKRAELVVEQSKELKKKVVGTALPQVALKADYTRQDASGVTSSTFNRTQRAVGLELKQSLFQGQREFALLDKSNNQIAQSKEALKLTRNELYIEVTSSYLEVLFSESEVELAREIERLSKERVDYLTDRVRKGRSRQSELLSAQAALSSAKNDLISLNANLNRNRKLFSFITGLGQDTKLVSVASNPSHKDLSYFLNKSTSAPQMSVDKLRVDDSYADIKVAKAGHWPSVDLKADYFIDRESVSTRGSDWAVTLSFSLPLFESGKTKADIAQASYAKNIAESNYRYNKEKLETQVKNLYLDYKATQDQIKSYENTVELYKKNYIAQQKEYNLSLVNNLEVLQSLNLYTESRSNLNRLKTNAHQLYYRLLATVGDSLELN